LETFPGFILGSARVNLDGETDPFVVRVVDVDRRVVDAASHDLAGRASAHDLHGVLVRHARLELRLVMGLDPLGGKRLGVKRHLVDEAVKSPMVGVGRDDPDPTAAGECDLRIVRRSVRPFGVDLHGGSVDGRGAVQAPIEVDPDLESVVGGRQVGFRADRGQARAVGGDDLRSPGTRMRSSTCACPFGRTLRPYCVVPAKLSFSRTRCWNSVGPSHLTLASIVILGGLSIALLGTVMRPIAPSKSAALLPP
jgi:hypothetical protein